MRSEADIRREVEGRLRRRGLFVLNAVLWAGTAALLWITAAYVSFGGFAGLVIWLMIAWAGVVGLHFLRTVYVELREWLVRRAINNERRTYVMRDEYDIEKPKRASVSRLEMTDDGELIDFPEIDERAGTQR